MIRFDHDALICDMAETYHIYDLRALPLSTVAVLAVGLRENSRIKMKLSGMQATVEQMLGAMAVDRLSLLWWAKTTDGANNRNRPKMISDIFTGKAEQRETIGFETPEDFHKAWNS
jgi:hypothetical protein